MSNEWSLYFDTASVEELKSLLEQLSQIHCNAFAGVKSKLQSLIDDYTQGVA